MNERGCLTYCIEFQGRYPDDKRTAQHALDWIIPKARKWATTPADFAAINAAQLWATIMTIPPLPLPALPPLPVLCKGTNCTSIDGKNHSPECLAEYEANCAGAVSAGYKGLLSEEVDALPYDLPPELSPWFDLFERPWEAGKYEIGSAIRHVTITPMVPPWRALWDGREWVDLPNIEQADLYWRGLAAPAA